MAKATFLPLLLSCTFSKHRLLLCLGDRFYLSLKSRCMVSPLCLLLYGRHWRVNSNGVVAACCTLLVFVVMLTTCQINSAAVPITERQPGKYRATSENKAATDSQEAATINTPTYKATVHWAIPFTPRGAGEGLIQADTGCHFVLLDISLQNVSADKPVDGQEVLQSTKIRDEQGREYASDPLVIAAFNLEYPYPQHQMQYRAFKGMLLPGAVHRTVVCGFEAPVDAKNFVLLMEDDAAGTGHNRYETAFAVR